MTLSDIFAVTLYEQHAMYVTLYRTHQACDEWSWFYKGQKQRQLDCIQAAKITPAGLNSSDLLASRYAAGNKQIYSQQSQ